jgi:hypothetical protein
MNNIMVEDFTRRYNARIHYQYYRNSPHASLGALDYTDPRDRVEIELPVRAFQDMVRLDNRAEEDSREQQEERQIRAKYPAVADAYDKYKMLLALCN